MPSPTLLQQGYSFFLEEQQGYSCYPSLYQIHQQGAVKPNKTRPNPDPAPTRVPEHAFFIFILKKTNFQKYMSNWEIFKNGCLSPIQMTTGPKCKKNYI